MMTEIRGTKLRIFCSGGMWSVLQDVAFDYQQMTGVRLYIESAPSMGTSPKCIPQRLEKNQKADVLVMFDGGMKPLAAKNWIKMSERVPLARSYIGMAVPIGTDPMPDISTPGKLKEVLLNAKHVAYSDSSSGCFISEVLFSKLGIQSEMKDKCEKIHVTPTGDEMGKVLASGIADIGFQHLSELRAVKEDINVVGLIPHSLQKTTLFSAVPMVNAANPTAASDFIHYLASDEVALVIATKGLMPESHTNDYDLKEMLDIEYKF